MLRPASRNAEPTPTSIPRTNRHLATPDFAEKMAEVLCVYRQVRILKQASKLARSVLRHIRVASKQELKDRIMAAMDYFNQEPVVHTWAYKLDKAA
jgi:hypothetical protein